MDKEGINNFIPMRYEVRIRNGRKRRELVPVISDLIFVHSVQSELQKVKFKLPYFQYMIDIRNGQKIIVPDDQMRQFIAVAGTYDEHLIFFSPDEVNLPANSNRSRYRVRSFISVPPFFIFVFAVVVHGVQVFSRPVQPPFPALFH